VISGVLFGMPFLSKWFGESGKGTVSDSDAIGRDMFVGNTKVQLAQSIAQGRSKPMAHHLYPLLRSLVFMVHLSLQADLLLFSRQWISKATITL
jgi:hypothetical protein